MSKIARDNSIKDFLRMLTKHNFLKKMSKRILIVIKKDRERIPLLKTVRLEN